MAKPLRVHLSNDGEGMLLVLPMVVVFIGMIIMGLGEEVLCNSLLCCLGNLFVLFMIALSCGLIGGGLIGLVLILIISWCIEFGLEVRK